MTVSAFEEMDAAVNSSFDSANFSAVREHLNQANIEIEEMEQNLSQADIQQQNLNNSIEKGTGLAGGLERKIIGIIGAYASFKGVQKVLDITDVMNQTTARLNLMNDGLQTTKELQDMIYLSAQRSRSEYQTTADMVSQLGLNAKDAFSSNVELIKFAEQLNKSMVIAGASGMAAESTVYNLTQALSTGVLRGQDLNAVLSNSPNIVQNIADYLEVPMGQIRDMAAEGQITAEIVKNAMLAAADETNEAFESMPMTYDQIWTSISNSALMAFQPIFDRLTELGNSEHFQVLVDGIIDSLVFVSGVVIEIFDLVAQVGAFISDNWSIISPLIYGVAAALALYATYQIIANTVQAISTGIQTAYAIALAIKTGATIAQTAATHNLTVAQWALNSALMASPITWIIALIIGLIVVIYGVVAAINKFAGTTYSATGLIAGYFAVCFTRIYNKFVVRIWNAIAAFVNFFANVFTDPIASIKILFLDLTRTVLGYIMTIAKGIESLVNKIPGVEINVTAGLDSLYTALDSAKDRIKDESGWKEVVGELEYIQYEDAFNKGYEFGKGIEDTISNFDPSALFDTSIPDPSDYAFDYAGGIDSVPSNIADTAENTGAIKNSVDISQEDLKYLRDIAEMEVINRFTTAEIKVEMTNNNNINNEMDLDGVVDYLGEGVEEAMEKASRGVHD